MILWWLYPAHMALELWRQAITVRHDAIILEFKLPKRP